MSSSDRDRPQDRARQASRDRDPKDELRAAARGLRDSLTTREGVEVERTDTLLRAGLSLLFAIIMSVVDTVLIALVFFSLIYAFVTRQPPNPQVRSFSNRVVSYAYRVYRYLTYNEARAPFPFGDFPEEVEPSAWSNEQTESERLGLDFGRVDELDDDWDDDRR
jgi:hypothetical protein